MVKEGGLSMTAQANHQRSRNPEASQEAILVAAEACFAEKGYSGTSIQDIATNANVSRGTPSYFFGSKEGLYKAVLDRAFEAIRQLNAKSVSSARAKGADARGIFAEVISNYIDFLAAHPNFMRLLQWETLSGMKIVPDMPSQLLGIQEAIDVMSEQLLDVSHNELRHLLISVIALAWFPFAHKDTLLKSLGLDPYDATFIKDRKEHIVNLLINGILHD